MTTTSTCEKCWNERQSLGGMTFQDLGTGEVWTLEVSICGTCRREIMNSVSFLRFHGANVHHDGSEGITVNAPPTNGSLSSDGVEPLDLPESPQIDPKGSRKAKSEG